MFVCLFDHWKKSTTRSHSCWTPACLDEALHCGGIGDGEAPLCRLSEQSRIRTVHKLFEFYRVHQLQSPIFDSSDVRFLAHPETLLCSQEVLRTFSQSDLHDVLKGPRLRRFDCAGAPV